MNNQTAQLLEQHFDTAFAAPNGIAKLRELILTLAMQGKLVEQDSNDPPASELLKEIEAEKQRLVKAGKITKPKPVPPIKSEEVPYELPQGWKWVRLGEMAEYNGRKNISGDEIGPDNWLLDLEDIEKGTSRILNRVKFSERQSKSTKSTFQKGDVLYGKLRPYLDKVVVADADGVCTTEIVPIVPFSGIHPEFLRWLLKRPEFLAHVNSLMYGVKMPRLGTDDAVMSIHPLPPFSEQRRIVARIDQLMARCDELEKLRKARESQRLVVHTSAIKQLLDAPDGSAWDFIQQHFGELYTVKQNVTELRKAILQLAVMGRLVEQDPNDPPASELLKDISRLRTQLLENGYPNESESRTQARKQDKQELPKSLPVLPNGWVWATLMQCALIVVDCHNKTAPYTNSGIVLLRTSNIRNGRILLDDVKYITQKTFDRWAARATPEAGDLLITREAPMGEVCIIPKEPKVCMGQRMMLIRVVPKTINSQFLLYTLRDPNLMDRVQDKPVGMTVQHLRVGGVETLLVPVPPLPEQNRIVEKINQLTALCDALEQQIDAAREKQSELLNTLLNIQPRQESDIADPAAYRSTIGCYVVKNMAASKYFGRTTAAKTLYLAQAHAGLDLDLSPVREAAGPFDERIYDFEAEGESNGWFKVKKKQIKAGHTKTEYIPMPGLTAQTSQAESTMTAENRRQLDNLIGLLKDKTTEEVEIIATLFAAWNDFLIDGIKPSDDKIITEVRENWHERKSRFSPKKLSQWLAWMRSKKLVPQGRSPKTIQQYCLKL